MFIITYKKLFLGIASLMVLLSVVSVFVYGLTPGIDFTGGSRSTLEYGNTYPTQAEIVDAIDKSGLGAALVQPTGKEGTYTVKLKSLSEAERTTFKTAVGIDGAYAPEETSFTLVGPTVGKELQSKAYIAITLVVLAIVSFIAFSFRGISKPVASWKYGLIAIVTLVHDIIIPTGVYAFIGHKYGVEVDILFVIALLTILGVSISDTIVIFDRIRENLKNAGSKSFEQIVGKSLSQSFVRSINTSLTVIIVLAALFVFGPVSTKYFALILLIGVGVGTYSSIFVASPLLTIVEAFQRRK